MFDKREKKGPKNAAILYNTHGVDGRIQAEGEWPG